MPEIADVHLQKCVSCSPADGEKLFEPWSSWSKGQECLRGIWTEKYIFVFNCFLFSDFSGDSF